MTMIKHSIRTSHRRCSVKKIVLRNFAKITGKHLCQSFLFRKFASSRPANLLKKGLSCRCLPVSFAKFLRTPFLQNTSGQLLLNIRTKITPQTSIIVCSSDGFSLQNTNNFLNISTAVVLARVLSKPAVDVQFNG